jgi:hypothetical protein
LRFNRRRPGPLETLGWSSGGCSIGEHNTKIYYLLDAAITPVRIQIEETLFSLPACGWGAAKRRMEPCEPKRD